MARKYFRKYEVLLHHLNDSASRLAGKQVSARIDGGYGGIAWHSDAEGFYHAGHGGCGAHGHTMPVRAMHARLRFMELIQRNLSRAKLLTHRYCVRTGT